MGVAAPAQLVTCQRGTSAAAALPAAAAAPDWGDAADKAEKTFDKNDKAAKKKLSGG